MRAIALALAASLAITSIATAAPKWPGWDCTEPAIWEQYEADAETPNQIADARIMLAYIANQPADFPAMLDLVTNAVKGIRYSDDAERNAKAVAGQIVSKTKQHCYCRNIFTEEAWAFCQANPTSYDIHFVMRDARRLGLSNDFIYAKCREQMMYAALHLSAPGIYTRKIITMMIKTAADLDDVSNVRADLEKLNRKLSLKLLNNKDWEPVVATIRTAIETF